MTPNISEKIKAALASNKLSSSDISSVREYIEASNNYKVLVTSGLIKPRGNNLLSKEKALNSSIRFNK